MLLLSVGVCVEARTHTGAVLDSLGHKQVLSVQTTESTASGTAIWQHSGITIERSGVPWELESWQMWPTKGRATCFSCSDISAPSLGAGQPLNRSCDVTEPIAVGKPHLNSLTLSPGAHAPLAFHTITCPHSESRPTCPGGLSEKSFKSAP